MANVTGKSSEDGTPGVLGESEKFNGVLGITTADGHAGVAGVCDQGKSNGVYGRSKSANGVIGFSSADGSSGVAGVNDEGNGVGVYGRSARAAGVHGESKGFNGVFGITTADGHAGVAGVCDQGKSNGLYGRSAHANGVWGESKEWIGVYGKSESTTAGAGVMGEAPGSGVIGKSQTWHGVYGETPSTTGGAGVWGEHKGGGSGVAGISASGAGVYGKGGRVAGFFEGDVEVTGDIRLTNADCAEDFDIAEAAIADPGTVMVLNESGALQPSQHAYDKRVAGVVSGAGEYKPGIVLDKKNSDRPRKPVALLGKVFCKVDASQSAIEVGDLLTTSTIPGHAMKVIDSTKALGTIIGKALRPFRDGQGMIPILIALQ